MMLSFITKLVLSTGVGIASQVVVKDVLVKLVTVPSSAVVKTVYAVGIVELDLLYHIMLVMLSKRLMTQFPK